MSTYKVNKFVNPEASNPINQIIEDTLPTTAAGLRDYDFKSNALFSFQNSAYANGLYLDELDNLDQCSTTKSIDIILNGDNGCVEIKPGMMQAQLVTMRQFGEYETSLDDFSVMADTYIPDGASVEYYISTDDLNYVPITNDSNKPPVHFGQMRGTSFRLKVILRANAQGHSPKLFGYAVFYFDELVDYNYGMTNPDLRRFESTTASSVTLVRDRAQEDKLVRVISPESITELEYDPIDGRLMNVIENTGKTISNTSLDYGNYLNSKGKIENVLISIQTEPVSAEDVLPPEYVFEGGTP